MLSSHFFGDFFGDGSVMLCNNLLFGGIVRACIFLPLNFHGNV
jgi:hypothetical protein